MPDDFDRVRKVLVEWGCEPGASPHGWRCEYPERYGDCDCLNEMANDVLRALNRSVR
jgi:hypothetical protein